MLESLVGAPANSLSASQYYPGLKAEACSDAVVAQLQLLHAAILAEGGLLPTAMAIAAECGKVELDPIDLNHAASKVAAGAVAEGRLAAAAAIMAGLLTEARAYDDSPQRQALVGRVTALIALLRTSPWPQPVTVGGQRIARIVEALSRLPGDSLAAYTSEAAASLSTRSLEIAEQRLGLAARALLAPEGLLQAAREVAAARSGCLDADTIEPADLLAAGPKVLLLRDQAAVEVVGEFVTPEGVAAVAEMLAGWLREAQAEAGRACSTFTFCTTCGFALPCPWGC